MGKEKQMTLVIADDTHEALKAHCDKNGLKIRHVVTMAIMAYIGKYSTKKAQ